MLRDADGRKLVWTWSAGSARRVTDVLVECEQLGDRVPLVEAVRCTNCGIQILVKVAKRASTRYAERVVLLRETDASVKVLLTNI